MSPVEKPTQADERRLSDAEAQLTFALNLRGSGVPAGRWGWATDHGVWLLKLAREALAARRLAADQAARTTTTEGERERVARLVDPQAWELRDSWAERLRGEGEWHIPDATKEIMRRSYERRMPGLIAPSLATADAILATPPATPAAKECPQSPDGRHHVDTSMESGPNNCFHCEAPMGGKA